MPPMLLALYAKAQLAWMAKRERGATAAEYALIVAAVVAVIAVLVFAFGGAIQDRFQDACTEINGGAACAE
jgi:pilus assembly protein Flp/PilA